MVKRHFSCVLTVTQQNNEEVLRSHGYHTSEFGVLLESLINYLIQALEYKNLSWVWGKDKVSLLGNDSSPESNVPKDL